MEPNNGTTTPPITRDEPTGPRSFAPRLALPQGRALVGALLITLSAVGAYALATSDENGPDDRYLVLVADVDAGVAIELTDVVLEPMTLSPDVASTALRRTDDVEGATALRQLREGAILDRRDLRPATVLDGVPVVDVHELTLPIRRERAPRSLLPGDRVTVLAYDEGDNVLRIALEDALVLGYDAESTGIGSNEDGRLTLALPDADLVVEATLRSYDSLTIVLTSGALADVYAAASGMEAA